MNKKLLTVLAIFSLLLIGCEKDPVKNPNNQGGNEQNPPEEQFEEEKPIVGKFVVSQDTKVQFSSGNLQYNSSTNTYRFAEHQYDCFASTNGTWADLLSHDLPSSISVGGENGWRMMTSDEWRYLISHCFVAYATVCGQQGVLFAPQDWDKPSEISFVNESTNFTDNVYYASDWKRIEKSGVVFLPYIGISHYDGSLSGSEAYYWCKNLYRSDYGYYHLLIRASSLGVDYFYSANSSYKAFHRLVKTVQ